MSVGTRLREERKRLGLSQERLASIARVAKNTAINWEKDVSSPTADALIAIGDAGVDMVFVLTGKRLPAPPDPLNSWARDDIDEIERELLDPVRFRQSYETDAQAEARLIEKAKDNLATLLDDSVALGLPPELVERTKALFQAACDPQNLALLRAADYAQTRKRKDDEKELLRIWLENEPYMPKGKVLNLMAEICLEHSVPHRTIVELAQEIFMDISVGVLPPPPANCG